MTDGPARIDQLADRVRWLDRYRRRVGIAAGVVGAPFIGLSLSPEWPRVHMYALVITMLLVFIMMILMVVSLNTGQSALRQSQEGMGDSR